MKEEIENCISVLAKGGIVIYPTDTIWGIGCDATNAKAVEKVFTLKGRLHTKSLIVLLDTENKLEQYVKQVPEIAWDLLEQVDTPLTIIYPGGINLAPNVLGADGSIAIRIVNDVFSKELIRRFNKPLVSTSANFSGEPSPVTFSRIHEKLMEAADYVVNWGREEFRTNRPSSILKLGLNGEIELIRQ
ncbi:MAG: L-threonylcarbamoyladenylate synthase [Bacteroidales bacterium]